MITLDCSEHIKGEGAKLSDEEAAAASAACPELEERYLNQVFQVEEHEIRFTQAELGRCIRIYGEALDFAAQIYRQFMEGKAMDFELSIDETATPTSPAQHFFVAKEMQVRGVKPATVAPRFCGEFQKGIDYIGDVEQYAAEYAVHAAIARAFGFTAVTFKEYLIAIAVGLCIIPIVEIVKLFQRKFSKSKYSYQINISVL